MKIDHIAIYVCNLEGARDFFMQYFGAKSNEGYHNKRTDFRSFFLSFDDNTRLELMTRPQLADMEKVREQVMHICRSVLGAKSG